MSYPNDLNQEFDKYDPCYDCDLRDCTKCEQKAQEEEEQNYAIMKERDLFNELGDILNPDEIFMDDMFNPEIPDIHSEKIQTAISKIDFASLRIKEITETL